MKYIVSLTTKIKSANLPSTSEAILAIEPDDYTNAEIRQIRERGYKTLAYLSIGTISTERPFYKEYRQYKKKRLPDWEKEYYMDMTQKAWTNFLIERAKNLKERGFDGFWLDNLDVYEEYRSAAVFTACYNLLRDIKNIGGYVMVNGGSEFFDDALDRARNLKQLVNGVTQEEVFSLIKSYSGKGAFGKQTRQQQQFYQSLLKRILRSGVEVFLLEYTRDNALTTTILAWCKKWSITGCCISDDVDL